MSKSNYKELKYKNIEDLKYDIPGEVSRQPLDVLINKSNILYDLAEKSLLELDEENAYIHFMKYFQLIRIMKNHKDYQKDKDYYDKLLSPFKIRRSIEMGETLKTNLIDRYTLKANNLIKNKSMSNKPLLPTPQPKPSKQISGKVKPFDSKIEKPPKENTPTTNGNIKSPCYYHLNGKKIYFISITNLHSLINRLDIGLLIMDCRLSNDYRNSKLKYQCCINIPEDLISKNGMTAGKIQSKLSKDDQRYWSSRAIKDNIILMDWNSSSDKTNKPLTNLLNVLICWDQDVEYNDMILILDGGYETVISTYPMITTNPYFVTESVGTVIDENFDNDAIDKIEYPSFNDILMKSFTNLFTVNVKTTNKTPTIDRSSKIAAEQMYIPNKNENLNEQIELANQSIQLQRDALVAEEELQTLTKDKNSLELELANEEILRLKNKLIVFSDERASKQSQIELLQRELTEIKQTNLKNDINAEDELAKRKIIELRTQDEELSMKKKEIEERREKHEKVIEEIIPKLQPKIDRSIKPRNNIIEPVIHRDFRPEFGTQPPGLTGLRNLGNSCYMNSIIQCLSNTKPLKEYFMSEKGYKRDAKRISNNKGYLAAELYAVINELWTKRHKYISISDLRIVIGEFREMFRNSAQQDSHEFLTIIIDWLNSDLESSISRTPTNQLSSSQRAWLKFIQDKQSYIQDLFYGQIKSMVKCYICQKESATYDGFSNLSLQVPNSRCDIANCLDSYFLGEIIDGWNCPKCKTKRGAVKKLDISILPPILVIHFKRFNIDLAATDYSFKKNKYSINFDLNRLNMFKYIVPSEKDNIGEQKCLYNLYAVSNHYGTMERGHYTAFCKNDNKWYKYDDNVVSPMNEKDVHSNAAYILFYKRENF